jgi:hypothetical protein
MERPDAAFHSLRHARRRSGQHHAGNKKWENRERLLHEDRPFLTFANLALERCGQANISSSHTRLTATRLAGKLVRISPKTYREALAERRLAENTCKAAIA